jgi:acid stress-induced BolA-like protein IbaG/YrbA
MNIKQVEAALQGHLQAEYVELTTRDTVHFEATIVSDYFEGLSRVKRQQAVYEVLGPLIQSGEMHAIALKLSTVTESKKKDK